MTAKNADNDKSCEEIITLLNEMLDGQMDPERQKNAEELIRDNPQCKAMYQTLQKTITLYRQRRDELVKGINPKINWDEVSDNVS